MVTLDSLMTFLNDFMGDVGDKDPHVPPTPDSNDKGLRIS